MSQRDFETSLGLKPWSLKGLLDPTAPRVPSLDNAKIVADALGLEFYLGPPRWSAEDARLVVSEPPDAGLPAGMKPQASQPFLAEDGPADAQGSDLGRAEALRAGFLPIPWHPEVHRRGSAPLAVEATWLHGRGILPDLLCAVIPQRLEVDQFEPAAELVAIISRGMRPEDEPRPWVYRLGEEFVLANIIEVAKVLVVLPGGTRQKAAVFQGERRSGVRLIGRVICWAQVCGG